MIIIGLTPHLEKSVLNSPWLSIIYHSHDAHDTIEGGCPGPGLTAGGDNLINMSLHHCELMTQAPYCGMVKVVWALSLVFDKLQFVNDQHPAQARKSRTYCHYRLFLSEWCPQFVRISIGTLAPYYRHLLIIIITPHMGKLKIGSWGGQSDYMSSKRIFANISQSRWKHLLVVSTY